MSMNLLESVTGLLTPELVGKAASFLGESESNVTKAIGGLAPAVLQGIINKAGTDGGVSMLQLASKAAGSGILENLGSLFGGSGSNSLKNPVGDFLSDLFGNKTNSLVDTIASFAGIKASSSHSLLGSIAPIALGLIGKQVLSEGLNAGSLLSWLGGQKDAVAKSIPAGLNLSAVLGSTPEKVRETVQAAGTFKEPESAGMPKWLLPLLLILLGALALWYFLKGCSGTPTSTPADTVQAAVNPADTAVAAQVRESMKVRLANGVELDAYRGGIEDRLVACIRDTACVPGKDLWFDFDDINFELGSATITAESQRQIKNIAEILKAYPRLKIKIGGYTDKTGDDAINKKLSQERADAVTAAIKTAGANPGQLLAAEGYGSEFAKVPADAPDEERRADRRISVSVREK